jgi:hypothetical protein
LGDGGPALGFASLQHVFIECPQNASHGKAVVRVKVFVLDSDGGVHGVCSHVSEFNAGALFTSMDLIEHHLAGTVVNFGGFGDLAVGQVVWVRKVLGKPGHDAHKGNRACHYASSKKYRQNAEGIFYLLFGGLAKGKAPFALR